MNGVSLSRWFGPQVQGESPLQIPHFGPGKR